MPTRRHFLGVFHSALLFTPLAGAMPVRDRHRGPITSLSVCQGKVYSASQAGVFRDGENVYRPDWRVTAVVARPDRLWMGGGIPGQSGIIAVYDLEKRRIMQEREVAKDLVSDLALPSTDDEVSWADTKGRIRTLPVDAFGDAPVRERMPHEGIGRVLKYAPGTEGILASGGLDGAVILHAPAGGDPAKRLQEHTAGVESLTFSPDGQWLASGSRDAKVRLHRVVDGRLLRTYQGLGMEDEPVVGRLTAQVLSLLWVAGEEISSSRLIAGTSHGGVYELSQEASRWEKLHQTGTGPVTSLAWHDGRLFIGTRSPEVLEFIVP